MKNDEQKSSLKLNRRTFLGAAGGAALTLAAAKAAGDAGGGDAVYGIDSWGDVLQAADDSIAAGVYPLQTVPAPGGQQQAADAAAGTTYNILLIMVDQLRQPVWLPGGTGAGSGQSAMDAVCPNIAILRNHSFVFSKAYCPATSCGPSRGAMLTGLYPQQTCFFHTPGNNQPDLNTGYDTYGTALSGLNSVTALGPTDYECTWIGKFHVGGASALPLNYGFSDTSYNEPVTGGYVDPTGLENQGNNAQYYSHLSGGFEFATGPLPPGMVIPGGTNKLSDPGITQAFNSYWSAHLNGAAPPARWFCAVSYVNPHDITAFPYAYNLCPGTGSCVTPATCPDTGLYCDPTTVTGTGYYSPNTIGETGYLYPSATTDPRKIPALSNIYTASNPIPSGWNNADDPSQSSHSYGVGATTGWKPGLQGWFKQRQDNSYGQIENCDTTAWTQFLNYYFWMQSCVDLQVGIVMNQLAVSKLYNSNTVVVFTADHGEYGGSHNMHTKGGGLYEEVARVPLYVSWPQQRPTYSATDKSMPIPRNNLVSGVDLFPFFLALGTGSESWRTATGAAGRYAYLGKRESIADMTFFASPTFYRTVTDENGKKLQYILHTTDEYDPGDTTIPNHAICFRTHGLTAVEEKKLGIYSFWAFCGSSTPTQPLYPLGNSNDQSQYEFYDLTTDPGETNNIAPASYNPTTKHTSLGTGTDASYHLTYFNTISGCELYGVPSIYSSVYLTALANFLSGYLLTCTPTSAPSPC